jgi:hypothetical protein
MSTVNTITASTTAAAPDDAAEADGCETCCTRSKLTVHPATSCPTGLIHGPAYATPRDPQQLARALTTTSDRRDSRFGA